MGYILRNADNVGVSDTIIKLMDKAAKRLSCGKLAAGYEQELMQLQPSSQPQILSLQQLEYVALTFQYEARVTMKTFCSQQANTR